MSMQVSINLAMALGNNSGSSMWKIVAKDVVCVSYEEGDLLAISDEKREEPNWQS